MNKKKMGSINTKIIKDKIMEKMTGVEITLMNGDKMKSKEVLDVGSYYYLLNGKHITSIKKTQVAQIQWKTRKTTNDSSKFVKGDNESCTNA